MSNSHSAVLTPTRPATPPPRRAPFNLCMDLLIDATDEQCLKALWVLQAMGLRPTLNTKGQARG